MEYILFLLSLFAVLKSLFMTSLLPNRWYRLVFSLALGTFVLFSHSFAMNENKLSLEKFLSTKESMMDISLFIMIDILLTFYFCMARVQDWDSKRKFRWYTVLLRHTPSLLIFPALYYIQVTSFFSLTGVDFMMISAILAAIITVLFVPASFFMRKWVGEKELLIELVVLVSFFIFLLVICSTVFHPSSMIYSHSDPVDWKGCLYTVLFLLVLFAAGGLWTYILHFYKRFKKTTY